MNRRNFVAQVREGSLVGPTQHNFSSKRWTRSYTSLESPSVAETRLHDSGIWFTRKLDEIRKLLGRYKDIRILSAHTIQAHVGAANWMILTDTQIRQEEIASSLEEASGEAEGGTFWPDSNAGYDAIGSNGHRFQIKSRRVDLSRDRRRLSVIRNLDTAELDYLIGMLFSLDFSTVEAYKIPHALIHDFARFSSHQNGHILELRGSILNAPGVEDISQVLADHP